MKLGSTPRGFKKGHVGYTPVPEPGSPLADAGGSSPWPSQTNVLNSMFLATISHPSHLLRESLTRTRLAPSSICSYHVVLKHPFPQRGDLHTCGASAPPSRPHPGLPPPPAPALSAARAAPRARPPGPAPAPGCLGAVIT